MAGNENSLVQHITQIKNVKMININVSVKKKKIIAGILDMDLREQ